MGRACLPEATEPYGELAVTTAGPGHLPFIFRSSLSERFTSRCLGVSSRFHGMNETSPVVVQIPCTSPIT